MAHETFSPAQDAAARQPNPPFGAAPAARFTTAEAYSYALVRSGPEVPSEEVELAAQDAIEVMVLWETNVLHVAHLTPPRNFYLGEDAAEEGTCDFLLPAETLGTRRIPLLVVEDDTPCVVLPPGASGRLEAEGQSALSLDELRAQTRPCGEWPSARQVPLTRGTRVRIELGGFVIQVAAVRAGKPLKRTVAGAVDWNAASYFGLSLLACGGLLAALAYFVPPIGVEDETGLARDRLLLVQQYLSAAAERERDERRDEVLAREADAAEGGTGTQATGESGSLGKPTSQAVDRRYVVKGPPENPEPRLARIAALEEARTFGVIQMLTGGDVNAPTAPWGGDTSLGSGEFSAQGGMWGQELGESAGGGGLGLTGLGEGGGGRGLGVGLGDVGTIGHGSGLGSGQGWGSGSGRLGDTHKTRAPQLRTGVLQANGRLPPEVIQRIVRQNFGRFRMCYEQGLGRNPNLEGRVGVRFVIGRDGAVSNVANGGSDLPDAAVVSCVLGAFYGVSFPPPEVGIVAVTYPLVFNPG